MQIPIDKIKAGITELAKGKKADLASGTEAAKAIMTTDTKKKEVAVTFMAGDTEVTIGGMAKGSGMIHPNMCTMLAFITTDAKISKKALQAAMSSDVEDTYNMISVDGDTSTNDTALLLANGMAGNEKIKEGTLEFDAFKEALHYVNAVVRRHSIIRQHFLRCSYLTTSCCSQGSCHNVHTVHLFSAINQTINIAIPHLCNFFTGFSKL